MSGLEETMAAKAAGIRSVLMDVDGVLTHREGGVSICDLVIDEVPASFVEVDGDTARAFIPCDMQGEPEGDRIRLVAGTIGNRVFEIYQFSIADGQAVIDLRRNGFSVRFISGRDSPCVRVRASALGAEASLGIKEKYLWLFDQPWFDPASTLFVSDNDTDADALLCVRRAGGIAITPSDAQSEALRVAECSTIACGGAGVVSEIAKALLHARGLA